MEEHELRCLEFFSGIGGMHYALREALGLTNLSYKMVNALDINDIANKVYHSNFGIRPLSTLVEHLDDGWYERQNADLWLMSPPCQPFTRGGKGLDHEDSRSTGLLHLIKVLDRMEKKPRYVFLENVLNFETSECHRLLTECLSKNGYRIDEYLLTPQDPLINIPNTRLRFYLAAERVSDRVDYVQRIYKSFAERLEQPEPAVISRSIKEFLEEDVDWEDYLVPEKLVKGFKEFRFDVVSPGDTTSSTFTRAYGSSYIIGTGSFLQPADKDSCSQFDIMDPNELLSRKVRYFTPTEIARLHGFPDDFSFPSDVSRLHRYRLLGNSLNVPVVAMVLRNLLHKTINQ